MDDYSEDLERRTFKRSSGSTSERVYLTLTAPIHEPKPVQAETDESRQAFRMAHLLASLVQQLEQQGVLTESDLDRMLLGASG